MLFFFGPQLRVDRMRMTRCYINYREGLYSEKGEACISLSCLVKVGRCPFHLDILCFYISVCCGECRCLDGTAPLEISSV